MARLDPRHYQIACLGGLLLYGTVGLGFDLEPLLGLTILGSALLAHPQATSQVLFHARERTRHRVGENRRALAATEHEQHDRPAARRSLNSRIFAWFCFQRLKLS